MPPGRRNLLSVKRKQMVSDLNDLADIRCSRSTSSWRQGYSKAFMPFDPLQWLMSVHHPSSELPCFYRRSTPHSAQQAAQWHPRCPSRSSQTSDRYYTASNTKRRGRRSVRGKDRESRQAGTGDLEASGIVDGEARWRALDG